jgi:hypothetical protein
MMPSPFRRPGPPDDGALRHEADELERHHGRTEAVNVVRRWIAEAPRDERRRLYRLHDEIARRH